MALRPLHMKKSRPSPTSSGKPEVVRTDHRRKIGRVPKVSYVPANECGEELSGPRGDCLCKMLLHLLLFPIIPASNNLAVLLLCDCDDRNLDSLIRRR